MSNCIQSALVERRHKYWPGFQASLASVPQPIRAKTGSKIRFSVVKEHALKYHRLDWYLDTPKYDETIRDRNYEDHY